MQTVFAEKTEDRSLDDNRHIGELFFIRMYWEKGRIPSGNILYWKGVNEDKFAEIIVRLSTLLRFATEIKEISIWMKLASRMVYY